MMLQQLWINVFLVISGMAYAAAWIVCLRALILDLLRRRLPVMEWLFWIAIGTALPLVGTGIYFSIQRVQSWALPPIGGGWMSSSAQLGTTFNVQSAPDTMQTPPPQLRTNYFTTANSSYRLVVVEGRNIGAEYPLSTFPVIIGRDVRAEVRVENDTTMSRRHAEIFVLEGSVWIRDLHSHHGVIVNGKRVNRQLILPGDWLSFGSTIMELRIDQS